MKMKIIRIDPITFQPKIGIIDGSELFMVLECDINTYYNKGLECVLEEMKDEVKSKLDESRHSEVDEVFKEEFTPKMTLNEYQNKAIVTAIYGAGSKIIYPTLGLAGEAGEVANKVKKILRDKEGVFTVDDKKEIAKEISDVMWYCAALANDLDYTLEEIATINLEKLKSRHDRGVISGSGDDR